nr:hypothetical protein [Streptococcus gallolyticus]
MVEKVEKTGIIIDKKTQAKQTIVVLDRVSSNMEDEWGITVFI